MNIRKYIIPGVMILLVVFIGFINYIYPIICMFSLKCDQIVYKSAQYYFVITAYLLVIFVLVTEKDNLEIFNMDKNSLIVLSVTGIIRYKLKIPYEEYYRLACNILGLILFVYCFVNWKKLPKTNLNFSLLGLLSVIVIIPLAFLESTQVEKYLESNALYASMPLVLTIRNFLYFLTFIAPFEEVVWRGVFWGQLRKWNINEEKIFWLQGILFWILHGWQLANPISFFVTLPIVALVFSLLVKHSKQVFPSIVSHTLIDTLGPVLVGIISRK